jgi:hypothetical protein
MANRIIDAENIEKGFLWEQSIIQERLSGVESDLAEATTNILEDSNALSLDKRYYYLQGFNDALTQTSIILHNRFNELSRERERRVHK